MEKSRKKFPYHGKIRIALAVVLASLLGVSAEGSRRVDSFENGSARTWTPFQNAPAAVDSGNGVAFPLPFAKSPKSDRFAWTKPVRMDLSPAAGFELEISCPDPESVRRLSLYFKSGDGWFAGGAVLRTDGVQTLMLPKSAFTTEGNPAGWDRIDGIRISPWRGDPAKDTVLTVRRLSTVEGSLLLVQGTTSCPDAGARSVAQKTTERISQMLAAAGIGHRIITDEQVTAQTLKDASAVLLSYNPTPKPAEMNALTGFLKRGGKLGVFYGASPVLAKAMGFQLGKYVKAVRPDRWRSIVFDDPKAWLVPEQIWQDSPNLMPALPSGPSSRVVAWWENARGQRQPEPAITVSPKGFWMSHILMSDDAQSKSELLVSLCAYLDPTLWSPAALRAIREAGHINAYASLAEAIPALHRQLPAAARPLETRHKIDEAAALSASIQAAWSSGRAKDALQLARRQRNLLIEADAAVQVPRPGEFVGVWDHDGTGFIPGDWPYTAKLLAENGVNAVFPDMVWGGCAHYPSKYLPASNTLRLYGDQIAAGLKAAKARGLQFHVWMVLWKLDGAPPEFLDKMKKAGRLQMTADGTTRPWLNPHDPANRQLVLNVVDEIARNYPGIDGIHLDYIRLPDSLSCFSPATRRQFEAATGSKVRRWPADVQNGGSLYTAFRRWRTQDITSLVKAIRLHLKQVNPSIKLSAAVFGEAAADGGNIAQYWPDWLEARLVDFLTPMDYTESPSEFAGWVRKQTRVPGAKGRIFPGIGVTATESQLDPAQVIQQITLARQAGCPGFMLFALSGTLRDQTLPALREGITRPAP